MHAFNYSSHQKSYSDERKINQLCSIFKDILKIILNNREKMAAQFPKTFLIEQYDRWLSVVEVNCIGYFNGGLFRNYIKDAYEIKRCIHNWNPDTSSSQKKLFNQESSCRKGKRKIRLLEQTRFPILRFVKLVKLDEFIWKISPLDTH